MPHKNAERLGRLFELMSEPEMDWEALHEPVNPDIIWEVRSDFPGAGVYTGYDGIRQLSAAFDDAVEETWLLTLRDGRISRITEYATKHEALESVGLRE